VLPKPSLQPGQDAAKRKEVLVDLAGGRGWKHFSRKSISAHVATEVKYIKNADGDRIGHQVHNAFIVHASWDKLKDADLSDQLFLESAPPDNVAARKLDPAEWKAAGIDAIAENESFGLVELPLLERVVVRGVMRSVRMVDDDSVTVVWELDPRFTGGASPSNTWAAISEDDSGEWMEGEQHPYRGAGGYLHISRLTELENACLVEMRMVLHEPKDWFRGSAVLRSKLPLLLQQGAKDFRRKVMD